ncbi:hypothetical protein KEM48_000569 [Puccinia striiformis f. sp. tritici PST-130]|nr:hypothetical protein KEM48_000569 [Puccinia striiformis f. sp. tritici PST-130]
MWRNGNKVTGTNDAPLGAPRRWGGSQSDPKESGAFGGLGAPSSYTSAPTTNRDEAPPPPPPPASTAPEPPPTERKRKSRWGAESEKVNVAGLPVAINGTIDAAELDRYAATLRLEQVNNKLRNGDVVPPEKERSPSPPPTYDGQGRRTNTREFRYRRKLEDERTKLIERMIKIDPAYRPPLDFEAQKKFGGNRSGRPSDKVYIPIKEFPEIKFFGLLVGPRGNSLKKMEGESGAKISIRGRGSVKEGKGRKEEFAGDDDDEMHCLVTGDSQEKVDKCVRLINKVIETACSVPESQNEQKLNQLRELAQLNGTFRDFENQVCQNCGNPGHRKYDCPEQRNFSAGIICRICGGAGHMARDCTQRRGFNGASSTGGGSGGGGVAQAFDSEYASLMAELGETSKVAPISEEGQNGQSDTPKHQSNWAGPPGSSTPARNGIPARHPIRCHHGVLPRIGIRLNHPNIMAVRMASETPTCIMLSTVTPITTTMVITVTLINIITMPGPPAMPTGTPGSEAGLASAAPSFVPQGNYAGYYNQ